MKFVRWVVLIPAATIIAFLITFPIDWFVYALSNEDEQFLRLTSTRFVEDILVALLVPFAFVYFGSWIAPSQRFKTSIVLGTLALLGLGFLYLFAQSTIAFWFVFYSRWLAALDLAGITVAIVLVRQRWGTR
jgi:hypothetical protein